MNYEISDNMDKSQQTKETQEEEIYDGTCSLCGEYTSLIFDKQKNGEPIYSTEKEGLSDLLATSICQCGHEERIIIYGKARRVKIETN